MQNIHKQAKSGLPNRRAQLPLNQQEGYKTNKQIGPKPYILFVGTTDPQQKANICGYDTYMKSKYTQSNYLSR